MVNRIACVSIAAIAIATFAVGCSAPRAQVSGAVTFQNHSLASGIVLAIGSDGTPHYGNIAENGQFQIATLPPGTVFFAVTSPDPTAAIVELPHGTAPPPAVAHGTWFPIPDRYAATSTAKLSSTLHPGDNHFDIQLTP